jgi:hypothetical protein
MEEKEYNFIGTINKVEVQETPAPESRKYIRYQINDKWYSDLNIPLRVFAIGTAVVGTARLGRTFGYKQETRNITEIAIQPNANAPLPEQKPTNIPSIEDRILFGQALNNAAVLLSSKPEMWNFDGFGGEYIDFVEQLYSVSKSLRERLLK